jgi:hypothetical protein
MHVDDQEGPRELDPPDGVHDADTSIEVLRAWIADASLHVTFDPETFRHDVSEWGRLLSDIAQHIAHAVELDGQMARTDALTAMIEAFERGVGAGGRSNMVGHIKGRIAH